MNALSPTTATALIGLAVLMLTVAAVVRLMNAPRTPNITPRPGRPVTRDARSLRERIEADEAARAAVTAVASDPWAHVSEPAPVSPYALRIDLYA